RGAEPVVQFNRDVRPILSDACYHCHGPDKARRKAGLRLDSEADVFADRGDEKIVAPGDLGRSELYRRITAADRGERRPTVKSGRKLSKEQIETLGRWIKQGAKWQKHWALIMPEWPSSPPVRNSAWPRNPIDQFVLARLEKEGLQPSTGAD